MFRSSLKIAPIAMIITNLAAQAYEGEPDVYAALTNIVDKMPQFVRPDRPRVPNPANPAEDYADKWHLDANLERSFWRWHMQVQADLKKLERLVAGEALGEDVERIFGVTLSEDQLRAAGLGGSRRAPAIVRAPSGGPVGRCHHLSINILRERLGRHWFRIVEQQLLSTMPSGKVSRLQSWPSRWREDLLPGILPNNQHRLHASNGEPAGLLVGAGLQMRVLNCS
jgi:hypothetical protein